MEVLQGYRLTQPLGAGGFGEVWEAVGPDHRVVALKFLPCASRSHRAVVNEVKLLLALRNLSHPHLVVLHDIAIWDKCLVLQMERMEGSLHELHQLYREETGHSVPPDHLCELLTQAALALDFLASQPVSGGTTTGMQHCDVKPGNLLLRGDCLKVADFGLCMPQLRQGTGRIRVGTPAYMPPEFADGIVSPQSDQYSLAVTYWELRTGSLPRLHGNGHVKSGSAVPQGLWPREYAVLERALDRQWARRWPSSTAFMAALSGATRDCSDGTRRLRGCRAS